MMPFVRRAFSFVAKICQDTFQACTRAPHAFEIEKVDEYQHVTDHSKLGTYDIYLLTRIQTPYTCMASVIF